MKLEDALSNWKNSLGLYIHNTPQKFSDRVSSETGRRTSSVDYTLTSEAREKYLQAASEIIRETFLQKKDHLDLSNIVFAPINFGSAGEYDGEYAE